MSTSRRETSAVGLQRSGAASRQTQVSVPDVVERAPFLLLRLDFVIALLAVIVFRSRF